MHDEQLALLVLNAAHFVSSRVVGSRQLVQYCAITVVVHAPVCFVGAVPIGFGENAPASEAGMHPSTPPYAHATLLPGGG